MNKHSDIKLIKLEELFCWKTILNLKFPSFYFILFTFLFLCKAGIIYAQKEAFHHIIVPHWHMDLSTSPTRFSSILGVNMAIHPVPGSISDKDGNLVFFSDGASIWNSSYETIPGGRYISGKDTNYRNALFIPVGRGKKKKYYLFTSNNNMLNASSSFVLYGQTDPKNKAKIDHNLYVFELDKDVNQGKGGIVKGKKSILFPAYAYLHATYHANGRDVWVITQEQVSRNIYAFLVTECGVDSPVVSPAQYMRDATIDENTMMLLKMSPNGERAFFANNGSWLNSQRGIQSIGGELSFDKWTGRFSNPTYFDSLNTLFFNKGTLLLNMSYSQDSQKMVFFTNVWTFMTAKRNPLGEYRYYPFTILKDSAYSGFYHNTQIFPDGKFYINLRNESPAFESPFSQDYYLFSFTLLDTLPRFTLLRPYIKSPFNSVFLNRNALVSNFISNYSDPNFKSPEEVWPSMDSSYRLCLGSTQTFVLHNAKNASKIVWDFGDGSPKKESLSLSDTLQRHTYSKSGIFRLVAVALYQCLGDTLYGRVQVDSVPLVQLPPDQLYDPCSNIELDAGGGFQHYKWSTNDTTQKIKVIKPATYSVSVTNTCGEMMDSVTYKHQPILPPNIFTPNEDGNNDRFTIEGFENTIREFSVFNRFGAKVYFESPFKNKWSGENLPDGLYYYVIGKEGCESIKGTVTIVR